MTEQLECEVVLLDGLDGAIVGTVDTADGFVVVYDFEKCIEIFTRANGGDRESALEHFDFNIRDAGGSASPVFLKRLAPED